MAGKFDSIKLGVNSLNQIIQEQVDVVDNLNKKIIEQDQTITEIKQKLEDLTKLMDDLVDKILG